jgi:hypothetical protein
MHETITEFGPSLKALKKDEWLNEAADIMAKRGKLRYLGRKHWVAHTKGNATLLVTFETLQGIQILSPTAHPFGWSMVQSHGWSHLALISDGDTWFRDPAVYAYFDHMVDECFFDDFDQVVFYGAGPCGYAAAAYSVAAPGARVLAVQPQATLDPQMADWDRRFSEHRRLNFTDRYGYAPDMLEAASRAYIVYDPKEPEDAMHAALFTRPNVTKFRMPNMGGALQIDLLQMGLLADLIEATGRGRLTPMRFARLARARRDHLPYLRRLLARLEADDRTELARLLCHNVTSRMRAPRFGKRLKSLASGTS